MAAAIMRQTGSRRAKSVRKSERLETRITPEQKELALRAAALQGRSLTDFVSAAVQQAAEQTVRQHEVIALSRRDSQSLMDALLHEEPAGARLRQAAERYKTVMGDR